MKSRRDFWTALANASLFLSSLLISSILLEVGLRFLDAHQPRHEILLKPHPLYGWDSIPPISPLNNSGHGLPVYFIGDSFTHTKLWPSLTQQRLREKGIVVDGYNLGVSGYGTIQEYLKLRQLLALYHPKIIVLQFFAWNDMRDNMNRPPIYYNADSLHRPYLAPGQPEPVLLPPSDSHWFEKLSIYSHLYLPAQYFLTKRIARRWGMDVLSRNSWPVEMPYGAPGTWKPFYTPAGEQTYYVQHAWEMTDMAFGALKSLADSQGCRLIVIGLDNAFTVDRDVYDAFVIPIDSSVDLDAPLRRLGQILAKHQISYINLLPALQRLSKQLGRKVYDGPLGALSGHLTPAGENVMAQAAAASIAEVVKSQQNLHR